MTAPSNFDLAEPTLTVSLDTEGRQNGYLTLPVSSSRAAVGQLRTPLTVLNGQQDGPTILFMAGVHGDEIDGVLALHRLARELSADAIHGRVIIVPALNLDAVLANSRGTRDDGGNLDACFPGNSAGTIGERLAHACFKKLFSEADLVLDLRAGGQSLYFSPMAAVRRSDASTCFEQAESAMIAFGAPNSVYLPQELAASSLPGLLDAQGTAYVQVSLGGAADITAEALDIAHVGCRNVLAQSGVLDIEVQLRASRTLALSNSDAWLHASCSGLLEPRARLGAAVHRGDVLACVVDPEQSGAIITDIDVPRNGVLLARRAGSHVRAGDLIALVADEIQPRAS